MTIVELQKLNNDDIVANADLFLHQLLDGVEVLLLVLLVNLGHPHVVRELVQQLHLSLLHLLRLQSLASMIIKLLITDGL